MNDIKITTHEPSRVEATFVVDDVALQIGRGVRPMAILEYSEKLWMELLADGSIDSIRQAHGVTIQYVDYAIVIAAAPWVLEIYDHACKQEDQTVCHGIIGLLLGYAPSKIHEFLGRIE